MNANTATRERSFKEPPHVLAVIASPHKLGNTAKLLRAFLEPLEDACHVDVVDVYREPVSPCTDCGWCRKQEGCPLADFDRFDQLLRRSDVLVVATPVYNLSVPAPLKAVLDRTQRYFSARFSLGLRPPIARPRRAALLTVCGSRDKEGEEVIARQFSMAFTVLNTVLEHRVLLSGTDKPDPEALMQAQQQARRAALAILQKL